MAENHKTLTRLGLSEFRIGKTHMPVRDSSIRSEGAELLVQAILMLEHGVVTSRASRNMPGYDVIAHNLDTKRDCKISVKYRKASDSDGFQFTGPEDNFDIVVAIVGNRGKVGPNSTVQDEIADMLSKAFVLRRDEVLPNLRKKGKRWMLPRKFLTKDTERAWTKILDFLK